jgi:F-type H+-transporting ATPase subunit b
MRHATLAVALLLSVGAATAVAQEHEGQGAHEAAEHDAGHHVAHPSDVYEPIEFWGAVVNFGLLIVVLVALGKKPMASFLSSRRRAVEEGLAEAQRMKSQAEAKHKEYSERLEQLDREIAEIKREMVKAGEAERDRIVADAEAKAARMRRETSFLIEQQMKQLRVDLTREAVEAACEAADAVLREQTGSADQQRLAQDYLERLRLKAGRDTGGAA